MTTARAVSALVLAIAAPAFAGEAGHEAAQAKQILDAAGVRGGLVVHLGCGDGRLTAALRASDSYLVHGLDTDPANVRTARAHIQSLGLYGKVTVARLVGTRLPYVDNLVTVLVADDLGKIPMAEITRVLAPDGVAFVGGEKTVKPRPADIDEWTHYLHGPDNNAVAHDRVVAAPARIQWIGAPKWARHHNHLASTSAMVTAAGRLFAIVDEGSIASLELPPKWALVARDAFNGVVLWRRRVGPWEGHLRPFRSGPAELSRRLVAVGDRVYATLGYGKPLVALDAATGKLVRTYAGTDGAVEIICDGGVLFVVVGTIDPARYAESQRRGGPSPPPRRKRLLAFEAASGKRLWAKNDADTAELMPTTLCAAGRRVFFQSTSHVVCLDATTGMLAWKAARPTRLDRRNWSTPTLVVADGVVLSADCAAEGAKGGPTAEVTWTVTARPKRSPDGEGELIAWAADDGKELWRCKAAQGYTSAADVFVIDGTVWASTVSGGNTIDFTEGRDLRTGKVTRRLDTAAAFESAHHHRCYRDKATDRFILLGRTGVELIDLAGAKPVRNCWFRGGCQYGILPANGLLYAPPHSCACYIQSKLSGFLALAGARRDEGRGARDEQKTPRLQRGPADGSSLDTRHLTLDTSAAWPTFRHDAGRSGRTTSTVPAKLKRAWTAKPGVRLSSPVIAEGVLLVSSIDTHTIHAIDAKAGKPRWQATVGGRVDSPPTIHEGRAIFGSADGYVYCLRLTDGALVWRFRAAPEDRRTVAFGQVESVWPVTGSVLVHGGVVYCTAGRSSFLDGGMVMCRLEPATGKLLGETRFDSRDPKTGGQREEIIEDVELPGALPDVLVCDGKFIYLRDKRLDPSGAEQPPTVPHLYCSAGLLDDTWWHRTYWLWGERAFGRASGWRIASLYRPSGRILVADETTVFGYGRKTVTYGGRNMEGYHLFRAAKKVTPLNRKLKNNNQALVKHLQPAKVTTHWSRGVPLVVRAMVLAKDTVFVAGPRGIGEGEKATRGALQAVAARDGATLTELPLDAPPVFDGMASAYGRLFICTTAGDVLCLAAE